MMWSIKRWWQRIGGRRLEDEGVLDLDSFDPPPPHVRVIRSSTTYANQRVVDRGQVLTICPLCQSLAPGLEDGESTQCSVCTTVLTRTEPGLTMTYTPAMADRAQAWRGAADKERLGTGD